MSSIAAVLKSEITRLSRREIRQQVEPLKKASAGYRRTIAALKRKLAEMEKQVGALKRGSRKTADTSSSTEDGTSHRFVAKGLHTLRARLGLSAGEFGKLVGVSGQSIYNWEGKKAVPRKAQVVALAGLRSLGKREARARLEQLTPAPPKRRRKRAAKS